MQPWGPSPTKALCDNDPKGTEPHTRAIGIQSREHRQGRRQVIGWGGGEETRSAVSVLHVVHAHEGVRACRRVCVGGWTSVHPLSLHVRHPAGPIPLLSHCYYSHPVSDLPKLAALTLGIRGWWASGPSIGCCRAHASVPTPPTSFPINADIHVSGCHWLAHW